ncbi:MAG: hypothetical protein ACFFAU_01695 [Candidatus Hodarchaeota archaeon]
MRDLKDTKLETLTKSIGLNQEDITRIKMSKRRQYLSKTNLVYWFGQFLIFLISLFYSVTLSVQKRIATYPFESESIGIFLAPIPLSAHIVNAIYSFTGKERSAFSKGVRVPVFFVNFSLFAFLFYIYYVSLPKVYESGVRYSVFNTFDKRRY